MQISVVGGEKMDYKLKMKEMLRKSGHSDINDEVINNFNYISY